MPEVSPEKTKINQVLRRVDVAWPTLGVALCSILLWCGVAICHVLNPANFIVLKTALVTLAAFAIFTPMHDAAHQSISNRRWINEWVGRISAILLMAPFPAFRYVHLEHHKHVNDPLLDPDHYSGRGPKWLLPLRWLTQDFHYYVVYLSKMKVSLETIEVLSSLIFFYAVVGGLVLGGYGYEVFFFWWLPARIATALLAFSFDYLPHVPHQILGKENRFKATRILLDAWLTPVLFYQNYHLIHHLYPAVPFYRYRVIFDLRRDWLVENGVAMHYLMKPTARPE